MWAGIELVDEEGWNADLHGLRATLGTKLARGGLTGLHLPALSEADQSRLHEASCKSLSSNTGAPGLSYRNSTPAALQAASRSSR